MNVWNRSSRIAFAVCALTLLAGCMAPLQRKAQSESHREGVLAGYQLDTLKDGNESFFRDVDELWVGNEAVPLADVAELPPKFRAPATYRSQFPLTLTKAAEYITTQFAIPVHVAADASEQSSTLGSDPTLTQLGISAPSGSFLMQFDGDLAGFLDQIAARTGNSWSYRDGAISIFHYDTRVFFVNSLPGSAKLTTTVSNTNESGGQQQSGGQGGTSARNEVTSGQKATMETESNVFDGIASDVKSMIGKGGQVSINASSQAITVTDRPAVLDRIARFIETVNARLTRQVVVDVRVINVELSSAENYGINWHGVYRALGDKIGYAFDTMSQAPADVSSLNLSVINPNSPAYGSNLLLQALATQGDLSIKTSATAVTLSGQPVPVQVANELSYISGSEVSQSALGNVQITRRLATATTGFSMTLLPVVLDNNDVMLQFTISLSSLRQLRQDGVGEARIEMPNIDSRQFMQRVKLRSGSTLVMSGFEQDSLQGDARGIGSPNFAWLGGGSNARRGRTVLVVILTPRVIDKGYAMDAAIRADQKAG